MSKSITTICIPRMKRTITKKFIKQKIDKCRFGIIQSIIERPLRNEIDYKKVTIRIEVQQTLNGNYLLNNTTGGNTIKIVYNGTDYWRLFKVEL